MASAPSAANLTSLSPFQGASHESHCSEAGPLTDLAEQGREPTDNRPSLGRKFKRQRQCQGGVGYLGQVCLDLALGVGGLGDAAGEGVVDFAELAPHLVGRAHEEALSAGAQLGRGRARALRAEDVVVREPGPRLRHRDPAGGEDRPLANPRC